MINKFWQNKSGMSLIEVMAGLALLGIALLAILNFFTGSTRIIGQSETRDDALRVARTEMDRLKADFQSERQEEDFDFDGHIDDLEVSSAKKIEDTEFEKKIEVDDYDDDSSLKKITLTISWDNQASSIELTTLFANLGGNGE